MATATAYTLNRERLATFLKSPADIRAFEALFLGVEDNGDLAAQAFALATTAIARQTYPVGAIFTSINPTDPATSLGYGTWAAFGTGRVLVGVDISDPDFNPVEKTGGSKTQTF